MPTGRTRYHAPRCLRIAWAALALASGSPWWAAPASAQCTPHPTQADVVNCENDVPDGYLADRDGLSVRVLPDATMGNGGLDGRAAVEVLNDSTIDVRRDTALSVTGAMSSGLRAGDDAIVVVREGATIDFEGTDGIGIDLGQRGGVVANQGQDGMEGSLRSSSAGAIGVRAGDGSQVWNLVTGEIELSGDGARGIELGDDGLVFNSGRIAVTGSGGIGLLFGQGAGRFTNSTTGLVQVGAGETALQMGDGDDRVQSGGTIEGNVHLGGGDDEFSLFATASHTGTIDGGAGRDEIRLEALSGALGSLDLDSVTGFERLTGGAEAPFTITGSGSFSEGTFVEGATLVFDGVDLQGGLQVSDGSARFAGTTGVGGGVSASGGSVIFEAGSELQADLTLDAARLGATGRGQQSGDLLLGAGSTFDVTLQPAGDSTRIDTVGRVQIEPGASLDVTTDEGFDFGALQEFTVLTATGGIDGQFSAPSLPASSTGFLLSEAVYGPDSLLLRIGQTFTAPARSQNQRAVGLNLDVAASLPGQSPEFEAFLDLLNTQDTTGAIEALDSLHPEVLDAGTSAALAAGTAFAGMLGERPIGCQQVYSPRYPGRVSRSTCGERGVTPWVVGMGRFGQREGRPGWKDWSYWGGGIALGADRRIDDELSLSAGVGASRYALDFDLDGDGSLTSLDLGLAAAWQRGGTHVRGVVGYGHGWHTAHRQILFPGFAQLATSDHQSDRVTLLLEAGHRLQTGSFWLEPIASLDYTHLDEQSLSESNPSAATLHVGSRTNDLFATEAGLRAGVVLVKQAYATDWLEWADGVWRPELRASWRQVWNDYDRALSVRFRRAPEGTPSFRVRSQDAQYGGDLGVHVSFQPHGTRNTIELGYDAFVGNRTLVHTATARLKIPF